MKEVKTIHPIVKLIYLPRAVIAFFMLIAAWSVLGSALFQWQHAWLFVSALIYPHFAYYLCLKAKDSKQQELRNMQVDAVLLAFSSAFTQDLALISATGTLIFTNAIFIGGRSLVIKTTLLFIPSLMFATTQLWPFDKPSNELAMIHLLTLAMMLFYFGFFSTMSRKVSQKFIDLSKEVAQLSVTDPLTGCYNRLYLDRTLTSEIKRAQRMEYSLAIIFADLDYFKDINDNFGHLAGDRILQEFVGICQNSIRDSVDWLARFGGEEFVIVLPDSDTEDGALVAERIRTELATRVYEFDGRETQISCSFGVASLEHSGHQRPTEALIADADSRLYEAKAGGRNRVVSGSVQNETSSASKPEFA